MEITWLNIFENDNVSEAMEHLQSKNDGAGIDGVRLSDLEEYWEMNKDELLHSIMEGTYKPGIVREVEIIGANGKRRNISQIVSIDRLILRCITQQLRKRIEPEFSANSFAYQEGKGTFEAAKQVVDFLNSGFVWCAEIDIMNYFDNIVHEKILSLLHRYVTDDSVFLMLEKYLRCFISSDDRIEQKKIGLLQGSPLSPLLSNLYLDEFDKHMEKKGEKICRFADNINIYCKSIEEANEKYTEASKMLKERFQLETNKQKSGVFYGPRRRFLGFYFERNGESGYLAKRNEKRINRYNYWHPTTIQRIDRDYHIINDGILTRKDFTVLFENEEGKKYLPVETMGSLNVYSNVTFSSNFFEYANQKGIKVAMYDKFGRFVGDFVSARHSSSGTTLLRQAALYNDKVRRLQIAKSIIMASVHTMRSNLRYYHKKTKMDILSEGIENLSANRKKMNEVKSLSELLMLEARNRQQYYHCFNGILKSEEFVFEKRTKRPPRDPLNAMISFGNMCLYQRIATELYKRQLDIRIGFLHATNNRLQSLNLDIAELFKPIIIDRTIFTLVNKGMIHPTSDFVFGEEGVYLNAHGKQIFLNEYENKLYQKLTQDGQKVTYDTLIRQETRKIFRLVHYGEKYKPFRYSL